MLELYVELQKLQLPEVVFVFVGCNHHHIKPVKSTLVLLIRDTSSQRGSKDPQISEKNKTPSMYDSS